jgi:hypothetical protein
MSKATDKAADKAADKVADKEVAAAYTANTDDNATCIVDEVAVVQTKTHTKEMEELFPSGLPLERPHHSLTDKCRVWDRAQADLAEKPVLEPLVLKPGDEGYQDPDPRSYGRGKNAYQE